MRAVFGPPVAVRMERREAQHPAGRPRKPVGIAVRAPGGGPRKPAS